MEQLIKIVFMFNLIHIYGLFKQIHYVNFQDNLIVDKLNNV